MRIFWKEPVGVDLVEMGLVCGVYILCEWIMKRVCIKSYQSFCTYNIGTKYFFTL